MSIPTKAATPIKPDAPVPDGGTRRVDNATGLKNMQQLIQLRWIAVIGQVITLGVAHYGFGVQLPLQQVLTVLGCLIMFNVVCQFHWRVHQEVTNSELFFALLVDVAMLTAQLFLTGGATNPFAFLYLLQVTLSAVLLKPSSTRAMVGITMLCFAGLAMFGRPLPLPLDHNRGLLSPYIQGMLVCFLINAVLLVIFVTRIGRNLRDRDAKLADLRQRAAEEDHIVRMGLLASGAAHELGTPLATLAVILGDWARLPSFTSDPELLEEINEMQAQVHRCKAIVTGILLSAGEARGESSEETTIQTFLDDLIEEWRSLHPAAAFVYENRILDDLPMVSDSTLKQTIYNILDNALEASPHHVSIEVETNDVALTIIIKDAGTGFSAGMLAQMGRPYQSSKKARPGRGLGLFMAVNVMRMLGGTVSARNRVGGGAVVTLSLPLSAIVLEGEQNSEL